MAGHPIPDSSLKNTGYVCISISMLMLLTVNTRTLSPRIALLLEKTAFEMRATSAHFNDNRLHSKL